MGDEYGTLERAGDASILRYERRLAHPQQKVWRAVTEDARPGGVVPDHDRGGAPRRAPPCTSRSAQSEGEPFDGEMLVFTPPTLMELRWADDVLRFELEPLRTAAGLYPAPDRDLPERGKAARDAPGWHVCLERLAAVCDGTEPPWHPAVRWRAVHRGYIERSRSRGIRHRATAERVEARDDTDDR